MSEDRTGISRRNALAGLAVGLSQTAVLPAVAKTSRKKFDLDNFVVDCILANQGAEAKD